MSLVDPANVAAVPATWPALRGVSVWAEEELFGHRLHARQTPWLLFLEFLNVANAFREQGALFDPTQPEQMRPYTLHYRMGLRNLMFNNEDLARGLELNYDDEAAWRDWVGRMDARAVDVPDGFSYLQERMGTFRGFVQLAGMLRQTSLEASDTNRRWSSRFIFPLGPDALYSDADVKNGMPVHDFTNFGRTGELVYLMLTRSGRSDRLRAHFSRLLDPENAKNRLVSKLLAGSDHVAAVALRGDTFLPYRTHPAFGRLADDWLAILDMRFPEQDAYAHLVPLAALHVVLYQLETAAAAAGREGMPSLVCEMIAPRREYIRQRSIASYQDNDALTRRALEMLIDVFLSGAGWRDGVVGVDLPEWERVERAKELLEQRFRYNSRDFHGGTVAKLVDGFRESVLAKHDGNCGQVHTTYGRNAGLVSRRGTNRNRYAPTDDLLKTLVLANVPGRMDFGRFLSVLYDRYGLVFGPAEASRALPSDSFDLSTFEKNRERLEGRLASMGLLNRLSDGCAFVENAFVGKGRP